MTIDERIERLEQVTAAHIVQARKDYEENRRLWREQQQDIAAIWKRMEIETGNGIGDRKLAPVRGRHGRDAEGDRCTRSGDG